MATSTAPNRWTTDRVPDQTGKTFLVTGANSGLGFATTRALARRGARVIMAVRSEHKGKQALESLRSQVPDAGIELRIVDLADLDSVRRLAGELLADRVSIDVLVNNAGVMMPPRSLSPQGHESQFAGNHLGHFALTGLLFDTIRAGRDPRVVTVTSHLHRVGMIHFDDLTGARKYTPRLYYCQSKFANVLFALELDRRVRAAGIPVRSLLAHPGWAATNLQYTGPAAWTHPFMRIGNAMFSQSADSGALPQLYAATAPEAESGQFIGPSGLGEMRGYPALVRPVAAALDPEMARRLWTLSEELTGVTFTGL